MKVIVNGVEKKVSMREWEGTQYSCDFFSDVETNVRDCQEMTEEEYSDMISYWESEVESFNSGEWSEQFGYRYEELEYTTLEKNEIAFFYD